MSASQISTTQKKANRQYQFSEEKEQFSGIYQSDEYPYGVVYGADPDDELVLTSSALLMLIEEVDDQLQTCINELGERQDVKYLYPTWLQKMIEQATLAQQTEFLMQVQPIRTGLFQWNYASASTGTRLTNESLLNMVLERNLPLDRNKWPIKPFWAQALIQQISMYHAESQIKTPKAEEEEEQDYPSFPCNCKTTTDSNKFEKDVSKDNEKNEEKE